MRLPLLLVLVLAGAVQAQPLTVAATQPTDFAAGVPLTTEVRVTFSEPLAAVPPLVLWPDSAATRGPVSLSADGRTAAYPLTLAPDTRYVALVPLATAASGATLARPAALNFTTAPTSGSLTVRGTVSDPAGAAVDRTLTALVTADLATGAVSLVALRVLDAASPSQTYALGPVPLSLYLVAAIRLPGALYDPASTVPPAFGFYDSNGDGVPDPVIVPFNVNVALAPLPGSTARDELSAARAAAEEALPGAVLVAIPPQPVDEGGAAPVWSYLFGAGAERVRIVALGLVSIPVPEPPGDPSAPALPEPFVDSDAALAAAEAGGGAAFRAEHAARTVAVAMGTDGPPAAPGPVWRVTYTAATGATVVARLDVLVDLVTGAVVGSTAGEDRPGATDPAGPTLRLAGAHPARGAMTARLTLPRPAHARVTVVDAAGRRVAVLADRPMEAGAHVLEWPAGVAPGPYWLVLDADDARRIVPVVLIR